MQAEPYRVARKLAHTSEQAMELARNILASNGFKVESLPGQAMNSAGLNAMGPGMQSNRQNLLLGAKQLTLRVADGHIAIDADLSSMQRLKRFVYWFPWGLSLVLAITLGTIFGFQFGSQTGSGFGIPQFEGWKWMVLVIVVGLAPALPWLILSPLIARSLERRTKNSDRYFLRERCWLVRPKIVVSKFDRSIARFAFEWQTVFFVQPSP